MAKGGRGKVTAGASRVQRPALVGRSIAPIGIARVSPSAQLGVVSSLVVIDSSVTVIVVAVIVIVVAIAIIVYVGIAVASGTRSRGCEIAAAPGAGVLGLGPFGSRLIRRQSSGRVNGRLGGRVVAPGLNVQQLQVQLLSGTSRLCVCLCGFSH